MTSSFGCITKYQPYVVVSFNYTMIKFRTLQNTSTLNLFRILYGIITRWINLQLKDTGINPTLDRYYVFFIKSWR